MARPPSGPQLTITHGRQRAVIVTVGAGLRTYESAGRPVVDGYARDEVCPSARGQLLIPWPNRLRDGAYRFDGRQHQLALSEPAQHNAIHGLVRWRAWTVREHDGDRVVLDHTLHPRDGWPFTLDLSVAYALGDGGLTVSTTARNAGAHACPYGAGAHPYLTVGTERLDTAVLQIPAARRLVTDDQQIPVGDEAVAGTDYDFREGRTIGDTVLDTAFTDLTRGADGRARIILRAPGDGPAVTLWLDEHHGYVMAFTGDALPDAARRRRSLGLEPMTCAPNALASGDGRRRLEPGAALTTTWGIQP